MNLPSLQVLVQATAVGLLTGGVYALMASGLTLIFGVMRVINVAHGAFLVLGGFAAYWLFQLRGIDPFLTILIAAPAFFVAGVLVQRLLLSRVQHDPGLTVLVTFALAIALTGVMGYFWGTTPRGIRTGYTGEVVGFELGGVGLRLPIVRLAGFGTALAVIATLFLLLARTDLGRAIRATMQNRAAAQLVGVNVARVSALTFGVGLAMVAAGGSVFGLIWAFNPGSHEEWISKMLSIIVLGGMGSLPGALVAGLVMGVVEALAAVTVRTYIAPIVFYLVLFLTLILRPQGLMGVKVREG